MLYLFLEKREIFKKERLPLHNADSDSGDKDITKEKKPHKKSGTHSHVKLLKKVSKHSYRHIKSKVKDLTSGLS